MNDRLKKIQDRQMEKAFELIREEVETLRMRANKAEARVAEWNKEAEISAMKDEIKRLHQQMAEGFNPSAEQWKEIEEWKQKHREKHHKRENNSGEMKPRKMTPNAASYGYSFSYTHLGTMGSVYCEVCRGRARNMCHGDEKEFERISKELDAEYFIGEI